MKFISVTGALDGLTVVINLDHVLGFEEERQGTIIYLRDSRQVKIKERIDTIIDILKEILD